MNEDKAMKAYKALLDMESETDLKKAKFTLYDYHEACVCENTRATTARTVQAQ